MQSHFLKPITSVSATTSSFFAPLTANTIRSPVHRDTEVRELPQEQSTERISIIPRLQQEAEKIRKWKTQTEMEIKQKDRKIQETSQTIESLRKSILELQIQNENLSSKLQEELDNRNEIVQKISATRDMCNVLKDYATKVEDRLKKCETERTELKYLEKDHMRQFEELTENFKQLEITAVEKMNTLIDQNHCEKQDKENLQKTCDDKLMQAEKNLKEMVQQCDSKTTEIHSLSNQLMENQQKMLDITSQCEMLQENLGHAEKSSFDKQQEIDQRSTELISMKDKLCSLEGHASEKQQLFDQLEKRLCTLADQINDYEVDNSRLTKELQDALEREKQCYDNMDKLKTQIDKECEELQVSNDLTDDLKCKLSELTQNIGKLKQDIAGLKSEIQTRKENEDRLTEEKTEIADQLKNLRIELQTTEESAKKHENEAYTKIKSEETTIKSLQKELEKKTKASIDFQQKFKDAKAENTEKNKTIKEMDKELQVTKKSLESLAAEKEQAAEEHKNNRTELLNMMERVERETHEIALKQDKDMQKTEQQLKEARETIKKLENVQTELDRTKHMLENTEDEKKTKLQNLECELEKVTSVLAEREEELQNTRAALEDELQRAKTDLEEAKEKEESLNKLDEEKNVKQNKLKEDFQKKEEKLAKQMTKLKEENKTLKEKDRDNTKKLKEVEKEHSKKIADLMKEKAKIAKEMKDHERKITVTEKANEEALSKSGQDQEKLKELNSEIDVLKQQLAIFEERLSINERSMEGKASVESKASSPMSLPSPVQPSIDTVQTPSTLSSPSMDSSPNCSPEMPQVSAKLTSITPKETPVKVNKPKEIQPSKAKVSPSPQKLDRPPSVQVQRKNLDVMKTPQRSILRTPSNTTAKKRRVMFAANEEESDSSSELMEIEDIENRFQASKSTPLRVRPSPKVPTISPNESPSPIAKRPPLVPVPRGQPMSKLQSKKKKIAETKSLMPNIRKTPNRSPGKFFKTSPKEKQKKTNKNKEDTISWFDSDAVFGFGPED